MLAVSDCITRNCQAVRILFCLSIGSQFMVNGCFWHAHRGCKYATKPKSNVEFWEAKIARNRHRDEVIEAHLQALGWHVVTIW
jgi:DNA mismatch endonuclease Vsr